MGWRRVWECREILITNRAQKSTSLHTRFSVNQLAGTQKMRCEVVHFPIQVTRRRTRMSGWVHPNAWHLLDPDVGKGPPDCETLVTSN